MFCHSCGKRVPDGASFCPACGAEVSGRAQIRTPQPASGADHQEKEVNGRMVCFPDGVWRWVRPVDLLGNRSQLPFLLKCAGGTALLLSLVICWGAGLAEFGLLVCGMWVLGLTLGVTVLTALAYCLGAMAIGRKYQILYEMSGGQIRISRKLTPNQDLRWSAAGLAMGLAAEPAFKMDYLNLMSDHQGCLALDSIRSFRWEERRGSVQLWGSFGWQRIYMDARDTRLFAPEISRCNPAIQQKPSRK